MNKEEPKPLNTIPCLVMKNNQGLEILATLTPRVDGRGYWLEFPVEPPFDLLMIDRARIQVETVR